MKFKKTKKNYLICKFKKLFYKYKWKIQKKIGFITINSIEIDIKKSINFSNSKYIAAKNALINQIAIYINKSPL